MECGFGRFKQRLSRRLLLVERLVAFVFAPPQIEHDFGLPHLCFGHLETACDWSTLCLYSISSIFAMTEPPEMLSPTSKWIASSRPPTFGATSKIDHERSAPVKVRRS